MICNCSYCNSDPDREYEYLMKNKEEIEIIKTATIEDLKQNHHVQELLEDLKFYANLDNWEVSAIDELCTVKTKLTKDKESFGECEQPGLASKLVLYGGKRARARLQEWE